MGALSRDEILNNADESIHVDELEVKELGGTVYVREMLESEFQNMIAPHVGRENANLAGRFAVVCLSDADGTRLFSNGDLSMLTAKLSHKVLEKIARKAIEINAAADETLEELEGN